MSVSKKVIKALAYSASFIVIAVAYQNCGSFDSDGSASVSGVGNGDIVALPNTKTASVLRASRVEPNLISCLGIGTKPDDSGGRNGRIAVSLGAVSEEGLANSVNQPMVRSLASIAAEYCGVLVSMEDDLNDSERAIFNGVDFDSGGFDAALIGQASKRLARSCWGRSATQEELDIIIGDIGAQFSGEDDDRDATRNKAVYLCTAMAASFATTEM